MKTKVENVKIGDKIASPLRPDEVWQVREIRHYSSTWFMVEGGGGTFPSDKMVALSLMSPGIGKMEIDQDYGIELEVLSDDD
jgi:hypothetical protein